jgi:hypothetical protein
MVREIYLRGRRRLTPMLRSFLANTGKNPSVLMLRQLILNASSDIRMIYAMPPVEVSDLDLRRNIWIHPAGRFAGLCRCAATGSESR